jgi:hypothetical protein
VAWPERLDPAPPVTTKSANFKCNDATLHRMRASIAGQGGNFGSPCNAQWQNSRKQTWFQDSYGGPVLDTVGHEFTHGIDYIEGDLGGSPTTDQGRQLNEAVPDVFGELIQHHATGSTDWVHNSGTTACWRNTNYVNPSLGGVPCSLNPTYPPDHWSFYYPLVSPCSRVNYSATIIGKIGYLMGREPNAGSVNHWGLDVTGIGPVKTGKVWYQALTTNTWSTQSFTEFGYALINGCLTQTTGQDLVECYKAILSVGLWSYDTPQTWNVNVEPDVAYYLGDRWVFYKSPSSNDLKYRRRTCPLHDSGCNWGPEVQMDNTIASAPSATTYDYRAWVCFRNTSAEVECDRIGVFGNIVQGPSPASTSLDDAPSLVTNSGALYLTYRRSGNVYWRRYTTAGGWEAEQGPVTSGVGSPPVLASADEQRSNQGPELWLLYRTATGRIAYHLFNHSTSTWDAPELVGRTPDAPVTDAHVGAAVYRNRLHVAGKTGNDIYYASCKTPCVGDSDDWTRWVKQDGDTNFAPLLEAYGANDGYLYLWHNLAASDTLQWRTKLSE